MTPGVLRPSVPGGSVIHPVVEDGVPADGLAEGAKLPCLLQAVTVCSLIYHRLDDPF